MIILGFFIFWVLTIDMTAVRINQANPNPDIRSAAVANVSITILTQIMTAANLVLITLYSVRQHYFMKAMTAR